MSTLAIIIIINEKVQIRECQEARTRASQAQASSKGLVQLKGQEARADVERDEDALRQDQRQGEHDQVDTEIAERG